ncbi:hypothetical protein HYW20_07280 [Candidatus Woesearchaeota archaeon]|nr:hypothetical protein [Candidatus Woesearchaeota archaeon]
MKDKSNKKSQTTIFMIAGLIILMGGILFFYTTKKVQNDIEPEIKIVEEQIPVEFDPVRKYANDCAYSLGVEGLKIIGKQGGYISLTNKALSTEQFLMAQNPTETDAVSFAKDSDLKIPYWWYLKSANNCRGDCTFASKRPELRQAGNSIEKQLERYINSKFKDCIDNFEPFLEQGFKITETGELKTDVMIATDDVMVVVDYPISAEKQDVNAKLSQFLVRVPVNLDKIYDLATKITNLEIKHHYLEKHVLNLLVAFSGVNKEKLPPMSEMQFKFGSTISWQKTDVRNKIIGMLAAYIPLFQVDKTYNYERNTFKSELKQRLYDSTIIPAANESFKNLAAYFTYLDFWPAYFDMNCNGNKCEPSSANSLISFFGIQTYRFTYDLSFPVLVEVQDPYALNGQGYSFNFFLEGNIRNNKPMPGDFTPLERASLSERSLLCDARTSGNISVNVANAANKKPVEDAQVLYTVTGESCFIGSTNGDGILNENFPVAVGGVANILGEEYIGKAVEFDAKAEADASLRVSLNPIYTKKAVVKKKNVVKTPQGWRFTSNAVDLNSKEAATITLTRVSDGTELEFSSIVHYEGKAEETEIAPGTYTAEGNLILNQKIVIPEKEICFAKGIFGGKECQKTPRIDFGERQASGDEQFPEGGLKLNFTISPEDLEKSDTVVFYVVSIDIANVPEQQRVIQDSNQIGKIDYYSKTYQMALQPTFS